MTLIAIVADWLRTHGYDGLRCDLGNGQMCAWGLSTLMPCHHGTATLFPTAVPAYRQPDGSLGPSSAGGSRPSTLVIRDGFTAPFRPYIRRPHQVLAAQMRQGFVVETLEGTMVGRPGDWLIRGIKGELYPCADDVFRQSYDAVDEADEWPEQP